MGFPGRFRFSRTHPCTVTGVRPYPRRLRTEATRITAKIVAAPRNVDNAETSEKRNGPSVEWPVALAIQARSETIAKPASGQIVGFHGPRRRISKGPTASPMTRRPPMARPASPIRSRAMTAATTQNAIRATPILASVCWRPPGGFSDPIAVQVSSGLPSLSVKSPSRTLACPGASSVSCRKRHPEKLLCLGRADALPAVRAAKQEYHERSDEETRGNSDQEESCPRVTLRDRKRECPEGSKYDSGLDRMLLQPLPNSSV